MTVKNEELTPELALEVAEIAYATDLVQGLEARGDFKYKGIFALFTSILEWTSKFSANSILPALEQLARETSIPEDRIKDYIMELLGRGQSNKERIIVAIPSVDYSASGMVRQVVFCRPSKSDGTSARRFAEAYLEKNTKSIIKMLDSVQFQTMDNTREIFDYAARGRLPDTQTGPEITRLFYHDFDTTKEQKRISYLVFIRPLLQKLLDNGHLVALGSKSTQKEKGVNIVLANKMKYVQLRYSVLCKYLYEHIASHEESSKEISDILSVYSGERKESLAQGQRQVIEELNYLHPYMQKLKKDEEEKKKKGDLQKAVDELMGFPRVVDIGKLKNVDEEIKGQLPLQSSVLSTEYPLNGRLFTFVVHKKNLDTAIKSARDLFDTKEDPTEVEILSSMNLEKHLPPELWKTFDELEQRCLFQNLPWMIRVWRALFGSGKLNADEINKLKKEIEHKIVDEKTKIRSQEAESAKRKLVAERLKKETPEKKSPAQEKIETASDKKDTQSPGQDFKSDEASQEILKNMIVDLDRAWDSGLFPNREYLLERYKEFDEGTLITFLKKHARKEIFSFRIRHDKPEYVWPIMISRRYLKQKGKALLSKYASEADEQRNALMPNQEKFDVATSIEDFLNRVFAKKS